MTVSLSDIIVGVVPFNVYLSSLAIFLLLFSKEISNKTACSFWLFFFFSPRPSFVTPLNRTDATWFQEAVKAAVFWKAGSFVIIKNQWKSTGCCFVCCRHGQRWPAEHSNHVAIRQTRTTLTGSTTDPEGVQKCTRDTCVCVRAPVCAINTETIRLPAHKFSIDWLAVTYVTDQQESVLRLNLVKVTQCPRLFTFDCYIPTETSFLHCENQKSL